MSDCTIEIEAPDPLAVGMIAVDLERRGIEAVPTGSCTLRATVADRNAATDVAVAVEAIARGSVVTLDGQPLAGEPPATQATFAEQPRFAVVVAPPVDRREKWDAALKRIAIQIGRDAGTGVEPGGSSFAVRGFETADQADEVATRIVRGLGMKLNLVPVTIVVPEGGAELLLHVEADRRELVRQLGYAVDSSCLVQLLVRDPEARRALTTAIVARGVRMALIDDRVLLGFPGPEQAKQFVSQLSLPPATAVQLTSSVVSYNDLGARMRKIREQYADIDWIGNWWDLAV